MSEKSPTRTLARNGIRGDDDVRVVENLDSSVRPSPRAGPFRPRSISAVGHHVVVHLCPHVVAGFEKIIEVGIEAVQLPAKPLHVAREYNDVDIFQALRNRIAPSLLPGIAKRL